MQSCPKCGNLRLKKWEELGAEEKMLVEKLPLNTEFPLEKRKTHLFCNRCWYEFTIEPANRLCDHA